MVKMPIGVTDSTTGNMGIGYGALYADAYRKVWSENGKLKGKMVFADEITKANNSFNWSGTIAGRSASYAVLDEFAKTPTPSPLPGEWRVHASKSGRYWVINTQAANYEGLRKCLYEDGSTGEFTWAGSGGYFKTRAAAQKVLDEYLGKNIGRSCESCLRVDLPGFSGPCDPYKGHTTNYSGWTPKP